MSTAPVLIVVSGPPGSGKTTIATRISDEFNYPLVSKDMIKESFFSVLGYEDRSFSQRIGIVSYDLLYTMADFFLASGQSVIIESNFDPSIDSAQLVELKQKYNVPTVQVFLSGDVSVLGQRFIDRVTSGERHPGHCDDEMSFEEYRALFERARRPLDIGGQVYAVDMTNPDTFDSELVTQMIRGVQ